MSNLRIKINDLQGFTSQEVHFLYKALRLQEEILNSQNFKLLWMTLEPKHNNGLKQREIYSLLMQGKSRFEDVLDYELDYTLDKYKLKRGTLATTLMSSGKIILNAMQFSLWQRMEKGHIYLSSSLFHEALHSQFGFKHPSFPFGWKRKSVPYLGGYLMRDLGERVYNGLKLSPLANVK